MHTKVHIYKAILIILSLAVLCESAICLAADRLTSPDLNSIDISKITLRQGPQRDELGEVLNEFQVPYRENAGLAWDGEFIWGVCRTGTRHLYKMNPENYEVVEDYQINQNDAIGMTFDWVNQLLWVCEYAAPNNRSRAFLYDLDGDQVGQVQLPRGGHHGMAFDGEYIYLNSENDQNDRKIYRMRPNGDDQEEGPNIQAVINHGRCISLEWVATHEEGHFWAMSVGYISQLNIDFDNNEVDVIQEFRSQNADYPHQGLAHDGFNLWAGGNWGGQAAFVYDDGIIEVYGEIEVAGDEIEFGPIPVDTEVESELRIYNRAQEQEDWNILNVTIEDLGEEPNWLTIEPDAADINPLDSVDIVFTANTNELETGEYNRTVRIHSNDPHANEIDIPVHVFVVEGFGHLSGTVYEASNQRPIEGAFVRELTYGYETISDVDGYYEFADIPAWTYDFEVTKEEFLPTLETDVEIGNQQNISVDFAMLYSVCDPDPAEITRFMQRDDVLEFPLTLDNSGNGPLQWSLAKHYHDGADIAPWEYRYRLAVGDSTNDNRLSAVEFDGENYYIAGGNRGADNNLIYVFDRDGNYVRQFEQFVESRYGIRDLTWDGALLWGADDRNISGFTTGGELIHTLNAPFQTRNIAYDPVHNWLWISNITNAVVAIDLDGQVVRTINRQNEWRIFGMSWFPDDPDGYNLYLMTNTTQGIKQIHKVDVENNDAVVVRDLLDEGANSIAGSTISGTWDPYSWVLLSIIDDNDVLSVWQLAPRTGWLDVQPTEGVVAARETSDLTVTLNTTGLGRNFEYTADLIISHDGIGSLTEIPVSLTVTGDGGMSQRVLRFGIGWNLVSLNVIPPNRSVIDIMQSLVADNRLLLMKDDQGRFYAPQRDINTIPGWNSHEGYYIKVNGECEVSVLGEVIAPDEPINLTEGWQMVGYYPRDAVDAVTALTGISENLKIVKDGMGNFYIPEFNFSNMGLMREGRGYFVNMNSADELIFNTGGERVMETPVEIVQQLPSTGSDMSVLVLGSQNLTDMGLQAVNSSGVIVGKGIFDQSGRCGLSVKGDDANTANVDGLTEGEAFDLYIAGADKSDKIAEYELLTGDGLKYYTNGLTVIQINDALLTPTEFTMYAAYPNPFNAQTTLSFYLPADNHVKLQVYDLTGRIVNNLFNSDQQAGEHRIILDADNLTNGIYFVRLSGSGFTRTQKIMVLK